MRATDRREFSSREKKNTLLVILLVGGEGASEAALGQVVLDGTLAGGGRLREGNGAAKGAGDGGVAETSDADVVGASNRSRAGSSSGHLNGHGEVHGLGSREAGNAEAWNVGGDLGLLESRDVLATRSGVDVGGQGASAVLVDLVEDNVDGAIIVGGRETLGGSDTCGSLDTSLLGALGGAGATAGAGKESGAASQVGGVALAGGNDIRLVDRGTVHEQLNHLGSVDGATALGAAQSRGAAGTELAVADDGGVSLGAAARVGAVTGSAIDGGQTGKGDAVGTLDLGDDTVGEDVGGREGGDEDGAGVLHFGGLKFVFFEKGGGVVNLVSKGKKELNGY